MTNTQEATIANTSPSPGELQSHLTSYDSIELLAVGGMGAVYKARQISLERPVAIKVLTHACSASMQFRQIFKCEAQVMNPVPGSAGPVVRGIVHHHDGRCKIARSEP